MGGRGSSSGRARGTGGIATSNRIKNEMLQDGLNKPDTSYQGKQFAKASGTGNTVDMMVDKLSNLAPKVLQANPESVAQIQKVANNPNAKIKIYRATIGNTINNGDWVFLDKSQADKWTKTPLGRPKPGVKVLTQTVKAKDVDWTGKNLEFMLK